MGDGGGGLEGLKPLQQSHVVTSQFDHMTGDRIEHEEYTLMSHVALKILETVD